MFELEQIASERLLLDSQCQILKSLRQEGETKKIIKLTFVYQILQNIQFIVYFLFLFCAYSGKI